ncbi:apolipoprotein N-acyltransferase [Chitinophaga horti]|uniref:Apolipoprotein N-acyltransferase n=1 Tax=Chitinophaga horti TaxID=2920382 RepID=A0ABY6J1I9_9BACT|nr:apolipoprotein N-acyltransferase [Chitinophaga horti]UYQ93515.1 apolipoprotein N-acyltransferase [Chitinophaga horti]
MRKYTPLGLALLSSILLWAAWPTSPLTFLIFIAFVPMLALADKAKSPLSYFGAAYLTLVLWNVFTTWWVGNTPIPVSGALANIANALLMVFPWMGYRSVREKLGKKAGYFALVVFWLTFEHVHLRWELSWPWLTLGNVFAQQTWAVQWYEYTGVNGGSLWVLLTNISIYELWLKYRGRKELPASYILLREAWKPLLLIVLPAAISYAMVAKARTPTGKERSVVIVQPNIDPYNEKFETNGEDPTQRFLRLSAQQTNDKTDYIVWPETALFTGGAWEHELNDRPEIQAIRVFLQKYPNAKVITGAVTLKRYNSPEEASYTARKSKTGELWDAFNSALLIDTSFNIQVYHKYKMVPGVEIIPYSRYLKFMENWAMDMGGISGSYGRTPGVEVFEDHQTKEEIVPIICYESIYGEFVARKVQLGANMIIITTNDGWWGETQGYKQHLEYGRLRAIETRRWIARCANTGVSCFIDDYGNIIAPTAYWKEAVIGGNVTPADNLTFYVKYGDYISKAAVIFSILLLIYTSIILRFIRRQNVERIKQRKS